MYQCISFRLRQSVTNLTVRGIANSILAVFPFYRTEVESRTQPLRPSTQKKCEAKAKDRLLEDRPSQGQGQECSRPRTQHTSVLPKKKKVPPKNFLATSKKKKKRSSPIFCEVSFIFQGKVKRRS